MGLETSADGWHGLDMSLLALTFFKWHTSFSDSVPKWQASLPFSQNQEVKLATKSKWPPGRALVQTKQNPPPHRQPRSQGWMCSICNDLWRNVTRFMGSPWFQSQSPSILNRVTGICVCAPNLAMVLPFAVTLVSACSSAAFSEPQAACSEEDTQSCLMCRRPLFSHVFLSVPSSSSAAL